MSRRCKPATATRRATLGTNWRSDAALVERLQVVLRNAALGDEEITVREVRAAHEGSRLGALPHPEPFRLRAVARDGFRLTRGGDIPMRAARDHIAADCAADIVGALASGATYDGRPLVAADVAVLVGTRDQGHLVQSELVARGVPAVLAGGGHVLLTPAADEMVALAPPTVKPWRLPSTSRTSRGGCAPRP